MTTFNLKSQLNLNANKRLVPCLNEYHQTLAVIDFDEVYEGYKIRCTKIESNLDNLVYYETNSNVHSSANVFKTLDEMCEYINEWKNESK